MAVNEVPTNVASKTANEDVHSYVAKLATKTCTKLVARPAIFASDGISPSSEAVLLLPVVENNGQGVAH